MSTSRTLTFVDGSLHYRGFELDSYSRSFENYGIEEYHSCVKYAVSPGRTIHTETYNKLEYLLVAIDKILDEA